MASATTLICNLLIASVAVFGQDATNNLRCYVCESETYSTACENSADVATIASADCSTLVYSTPKEENERSLIDETLHSGKDGRFRGRPLIDEMFQAKGGTRFSLSYRYACLKVSFTSGNQKGTTRSCGKVPSNIKDVCEFIRNGANPQVEVRSCDVCETDNCNSGSYLNISIMTMLCSVILLFLRR